MPPPQLRIASKLLGHLLWQPPTRQLSDCGLSFSVGISETGLDTARDRAPVQALASGCPFEWVTRPTDRMHLGLRGKWRSPKEPTAANARR